jgi:hypothetical protein
MNHLILIPIGIVLLYIGDNFKQKYSKTLERMSGPRRPDRASPHEDLDLPLWWFVFSLIGVILIGLSILITIFPNK